MKWGDFDGGDPAAPISLDSFLGDDFIVADFKSRTYWLDPLVPERSLNLIYARAGKGKTHLSLAIAIAIANGKQLFSFPASEPARVLYVDGEMPAGLLQEYVIAQSLALDMPVPESLLFCLADTHLDGFPNLKDEIGQKSIEALADAHRAQVIVFDNESALFRGGDDNSVGDWLDCREWLMSLRRKGFTVLLNHHANKSGDQRGTSAREDPMDNVIRLDGSDADHLSVTLTLQKHRGSWGDRCAPLKIALKPNGVRSVWTWESAEAANKRLVAEHLDGVHGDISINDFCNEVGMSRKTYFKWKKIINEEPDPF